MEEKLLNRNRDCKYKAVSVKWKGQYIERIASHKTENWKIIVAMRHLSKHSMANLDDGRHQKIFLDFALPLVSKKKV